jgi:hypothetical protein
MTYADTLKVQIKDMINLISESILNGEVADFANYKYNKGQLDGLNLALLLMESLTDSYDDDR